MIDLPELHDKYTDGVGEHHRCIKNAGLRPDGRRPALAGANADGILQIQHEDLAIADGAHVMNKYFHPLRFLDKADATAAFFF